VDCRQVCALDPRCPGNARLRDRLAYPYGLWRFRAAVDAVLRRSISVFLKLINAIILVSV